jgi:hypothetical protein
MKTFLGLAVVSCLSAALLCGCSIIGHEPYRAPNYFDVVPLKGELHPDAKYSTLGVSSASQFSDRMLFRTGDGERVEFDEYNRWVATPEGLLRRYIELSFAPPSSSAPGLSVKILRFELNKEAKTATVELSFKILKDAQTYESFRVSGEAAAKDCDAPSFSSAMREALGKAAAGIASHLGKKNDSK